MAATADEEARRLDQRIAEIRRKNEAILKRRKEIEEDKKLAEQQNAVVQLKPSTEDWPRERTPAMKPSKRELAGGDAIDSSFQDSPSSRSSGRRERPGTSSRGRDLMEKGAGPPPDPRSFLSDPDRDGGGFDNTRDRSGRNRNDSGQEFQERGAPQRDKFDQRGRGSGRRSGGREGGDYERGNKRDEAWRVERHKIDEARIQRQKDSDGRWRRQWDNEKLDFEVEGDDNKHPALTPTKTPSKSLGGRLSQWKTSVNKEVENDNNTSKRVSRGADHVAESVVSAPKSSPNSFKNKSSEKSSGSPKYELNSKPKLSPLATLERTIRSESENFKITVTNKESGRKEENPGRNSRGGKVQNECQPKKRTGILRTSQSSISDEDAAYPASPAKFTQYENMTFTIRNEPVNIRRSDLEKMSHEDFVKLSQVAKPPLPSFRPPIKKATQNFVQATAAEEDDDSWEDVTTSGTESLYESGPESVPGTPSKAPGVGTQTQAAPYTPEDFICLVPPEPQNPSTPVVSEPVPTIVHQTANMGIICQIAPPSVIRHAQAIAQAVYHQNPVSAIIHQTPASTIIQQNPASAIIHQVPPPAIIHQNSPREITHQTPPPTSIHQDLHPEIIHQTPPPAIIHQNAPPSIIYQTPPPSIIHHNPRPEISHQNPPLAIIYQTPPPPITYQTPPPPITHQTLPPSITHQTPPPPIIHQPPPAASSAVEEIISESIVFMPPTSQTITCNSIDAPPYPYNTVANVETTPNHSFNLDNYIVLVKPDTSFEEKVQLEHMSAHSGHLQQNSDSTKVLSNQITNGAIVCNNEETTKNAQLTEKPL